MPQTKSEKEKSRELKRLRQELEEKLEEQLEQEALTPVQSGAAKFVEPSELSEEEAKRVIEAILFSSNRTMTAAELKRVVKGYTASQIQKFIEALKAEYEANGRAFHINEVAGGYEISTLPQYAPWIVKLELQKKAKQATQSALETLAILAYKQPITRAEIEDLRGVDVSGVVSTLLERNLIKIVGRKEVPGRPYMYGTTDKFLEHFGLKSLNDLPNISEIKTLVENSVRRDDLLKSEGTTIAVNQDEAPAPAQTPEPEAPSAAEVPAEGQAENT